MTNRLALTNIPRLHAKLENPSDVSRPNDRISLGQAIVSALPFVICLSLSATSLRASDSLREVIDLNGEWMIAEDPFLYNLHLSTGADPLQPAMGKWMGRTAGRHRLRRIASIPFQPYFEQHVRDAFSPVGIMLDFQDEEIAPGTRRTLTVRAINDLGDPWVGEMRLTIALDDRPTSVQARPVSIEAYGEVEVSFEVALPADRGPCLLKAEPVRDDDPPVASRRMVRVE